MTLNSEEQTKSGGASTASDLVDAEMVPPSAGERLVDVLERLGLPIFLLLLIVFFLLNPASSEAFRSIPNIMNILGNQSVTALIALAMVIPLVVGYFDLSVAAVTGLSNVVTATVIATYHGPIWLGVIAGIASGLIVGAVNVLLVAVLRLNAFIATLGTYTLIGGFLQFYTGGTTVLGLPREFGSWGSQRFLGLPLPFWLLIVVALLVWYFLMQTPPGRHLEAIGSNESAGRLVGISVDRLVAVAFFASSFLGAVAGVLLTSRQGGADPTSGPAFLFPALAAVFLGATTIRPGRYNVWGTVIGIFLIAVAINGFTFLGAQSWVSPVFNGAALVFAVAVSTLMGRRRESLAKKHLQQAASRAAAKHVSASS
jgi:ribose transport system permease protein